MIRLIDKTRTVNTPSPTMPAIPRIQTIGHIEDFFCGDAAITCEAGPLA
jgi:hypothetical protein